MFHLVKFSIVVLLVCSANMIMADNKSDEDEIRNIINHVKLIFKFPCLERNL